MPITDVFVFYKNEKHPKSPTVSCVSKFDKFIQWKQ